MALASLRRRIESATGFTYDLNLSISDIIKIWRGQHRWHSPLRRPFDHTRADFSRTAIVAVYPTDESLPFLLNLLKAFKQHDFRVIVVSTKCLAPNFTDRILEFADSVIERHPIGRDFGSYQFGLWLLRSWGVSETISELALVNDSMYYPATISETLTDLLSNDADWLSLYENFEIHYHSQSFFQIFRREIIQHPAFQQYWNKYLPLSTRRHSIHRGEVGFTTRMRKAGFFPHVLYTAGKVVGELERRLQSRHEAELDRVNQTLFATLRDRYLALISGISRPSRPGDMSTVSSPIFASAILSDISARAEHSNPTHSIGLLANLLFGAPLKRDLVYRGSITMGELLRSVSGFSPTELASMECDLRRRGNPAGLKGLQRVLFNAGRI